MPKIMELKEIDGELWARIGIPLEFPNGVALWTPNELIQATHDATVELLSAARDARLMLYAWRGARDASWGDHPELMECIQALEAAIANAA